MAKHSLTMSVVVAAMLAASPAGAVKDFSSKTLGKGAGSNVSLYGSTHSPDNKPIDGLGASGAHGHAAVSAVPEPKGWLLMLVGFGLLGAVSRRGAPQPLRDELGF